MSTKSPKSSNEPMRAVDPQPMRSRSPSPVRANSYPGPKKSEAQSEVRGDSYSQMRYNPQDYGPGNYNPQNYNPQNYNPQDYHQQNYTSQNYIASSQNYDSQAYTTQSYNPQDYPPVSAAMGPPPGPGVLATGIPLHPASNLQDYGPGKANPQAYQDYGSGKMDGKIPGGMTETVRPPTTQLAPTMTPTSLRDLRALKTNCQFGLREYISLRRQMQTGDSAMSPYELEGRLRDHTWVLLSDMKVLHDEVRGIAKEAENHRWRRWIIGGAIATFIPFIRRFFRRNHDEESQTSANDTEYAFRRSKGLLDHIKENVFGSGHIAKLAFLVFAVLYVFSNEVSIRTAKTVQKRLKKLTKRIGDGDPDITENDMKLLEGWRWRVLLW